MKKAINWMADNHVATNLLMVFIVLIGILAVQNAKLEVFPEVAMDVIVVEVPYPGASPDEIEESICVKIEEQLQGVDGISVITSKANEGFGVITCELEIGEDLQEMKDKIKAEIDRIITFPENAEKPVVREGLQKVQVIQVAVYGNTVDEVTLKKYANKIKEELLEIETITQIDVNGVRNYEISIEVSEDKLRAYGLSFPQITAAVQRGSLDLPGGSVETTGGEILIRTKGLGYTKHDYDNIVVSTTPLGHKIFLKDIANIIDGFESAELSSFFDGEKAAMLQVFRVGDQNAVTISDQVKKYIENKQDVLPEGIGLAPWMDQAKILRDRIDLLIRNARAGLFLVVLCLAVFLDIRLALWVSAGIIISFLGAFLSLILFDVSINMISCFAFILVLGIVVDDAIVVGENIFTYREEGEEPHSAAKKGVMQVFTPVFFSVSTTLAAFAPMLFVDGFMGKFIVVVPIIVMSVLVFSLIESIFILPSHLGGLKKEPRFAFIKRFNKVTHKADDFLDRFINGRYTRFLHNALREKWVTISAALAVLIISVGLIASGLVKFTFLPEVEADNIIVRITLPKDATIDQTRKVTQWIEQNALTVQKEYDELQPGDKSVFRHLYTVIGDQPMIRQGGAGGSTGTVILQANTAEINIELLPSEEREVRTSAMMARWRELVGEVAGVESITFQSSLISSGGAIQLDLSASSLERLIQATDAFKDKISEFKGVFDIRDDFQDGKFELKLNLKPTATPLGLTLTDLAVQVRSGFYGAEALRIQRGQDEVKVMVRYPESERKSLSDIENMRIRTPQGYEVPFSEVAEIDYGRGYSTIKRAEGRRVVTVTADVDEAVANDNEINKKIREDVIPEIQKSFPDLKYSYQGTQKQQSKAISSLGRGFMIALFVIYALLAIPFRSYVQPLIVMSAIPFGLVGAIWGHLLLGYSISMMSLFGLVALAGIVVNDSLVLVDFVNKEREKGIPLYEAVVIGCQKRFRPILLTSLTTFFGLLPMMLEQSIQAQFLIPMALSLGFGVLFATVICLVLVPVLVLVIDSVGRFFKRLFSKKQTEQEFIMKN